MSNSIRVSSQFSDSDDQWIAGVFVDGQAKPICTATATTKFEAEGKAADKYRKEHCKPKGRIGVIEDKPLQGDKSSWTISTDDARIAGMPFSISRSPDQNKEQLASDMFEQEKIMAGLIEKAKRSGIDGRLIAMANTDFERGFMALDKALTTNKG